MLIGKLYGDRVILEEIPNIFNWYFGFVDEEKNLIVLSLTEALYLLEKEIIKVIKDNKELTREEFISYAKRIEPKFLEKYLVYKDLRDRGYTIGTALKFGADFRVYERGILPKRGQRSEREHSKWILYPVKASEKFTLYEFTAKNRVAHSTRKKLLIGMVKDNKIRYFEFSWKKL